jgi:internalin A
MLLHSLPLTWRRWLRTSTRGLIVIVLMIGAGLGWLVRGARIQRDAVTAIKSAGGFTRYDWQVGIGRPIPTAKPRAPRWLVELIGIDYFCHVTDAQLYSRSMAADAIMEHVGHLSRLERLDVAITSFTDAEAAHLAGLRELVRLDLGGTLITNAGLENLKGLNQLQFLDLRLSQVSDAGLPHLKGLTNLRVLHLSSTEVTDNGLACLKGLAALSYLNLRGTNVSDVGLVHLTGLTKLSEINLDGTQVTKSGMKSLRAAIPNLKIYHPHPSGPRHNG